MNVLFLTLFDFLSIDETGIYTDLLREFVRAGHKVCIISPTEKRKKNLTQYIDNGQVKILKLQIGNIQKTNLLEKGISTFTLELKFTNAIKKYYNDVRFDLVLYSTPPITLQKAVKFVKDRDHAKTYLMLKDIFPQNAVDLGLIKTRGIGSILYKFFKHKEARLYEVSDYIGCMSKANVEYILHQNPSLNKSIEECPNTIEPIKIHISDFEKKRIRVKYGIPIDKTVFVYGGNLGKPQGIDFLMDCIRANESNPRSFFLIVGSGTEYWKLKSFFESEQIRNAILLSQLPKNDYEMIANSCDVGMIFLDHRFTIPNFPSRILSYMQASIPVLAATDLSTDLGVVIEKAKMGYWCQSNDVGRFSRLVNELCIKELRIDLGLNARTYLEKFYTAQRSYEIIMSHFEK